MTARIVISCDAAWHGMPCRGALPTRTTVVELAHEEARAAGWDLDDWRRGDLDVTGDLCPAHARRHARRHDRPPVRRVRTGETFDLAPHEVVEVVTATDGNDELLFQLDGGPGGMKGARIG